jgi:septal ring factor EnvC (AmiA/AmiB activator)|tara:strand:+ start:451 stop:885 length:435 start_codon:yes stop_codon:yes gene_type:complete
MKLALFLGVCLLAIGSAFMGYYLITAAQMEKLEIELQTALNNQQVLENTIQQQNEQIKKALEQAKKTAQQIQNLNTQYNKSQAQVTKLRNKFANFNLEGMALTDPTVLEGKINRASARVVENLTTITKPEQFNEEAINNTATTN